jgi:protocatechuate 3,4-dioxygenase beta subunit
MAGKKDSFDPVAAKMPKTGAAFQATTAVDEGPYYKSGSPARTDLREAGVFGEKLDLSGSVMDLRGNPVAGAWVDFWQADGRGEYDNAGFRLRGHQHTDTHGKYSVATVMPGSYPGRTPHIHVKVRANENSSILTVQLFIPGIEGNKKDFLYKEELLINLKEKPEGKTATFDFYLDTASG